MMLEDERQRLDMLRRVGPKKRQTGESCLSVPFSDLSLENFPFTRQVVAAQKVSPNHQIGQFNPL